MRRAIRGTGLVFMVLVTVMVIEGVASAALLWAAGAR